MAVAKLAATKPFTVEHFARWAEQHELDSGAPYIIEPYFGDFLEDVFRGFKVNWLVVPEENAKTTNVAGLALYTIEHLHGAHVPVAASTSEQAKWVYLQAAVFAEEHEQFVCLEGYRRIRCAAMNSRIQVFAADEKSGDGIIPGGIAVLDELHRHKNLNLYRTWLGKLRKRGAQLVVISTAGEVGSEFEKERERLRQEADKVTRPGRCLTKGEHWKEGQPLAVIHDWAVPEDGDLYDIALVKEANPFSGITEASLAEKQVLTPQVQHWSRFTCNRAARSVDAAITEAEWVGQMTSEEIPVGEPVGAGLDVAWKYDTTALVPIWMPRPDHRLLGPATILMPPRDGTSLDPSLVEDAVLALHARNPLHTVVMDTSRAEQLAEWIAQTTGATVIERPQTNAYAVVDYERFTEALRNRWLWHSGDAGLTRHVMNAVARMLPGGDFRFERPAGSRQTASGQHEVRVIDALTAASMVHAHITEVGEPELELPLVGFG
jgi:phage terminase large subunit-like protein